MHDIFSSTVSENMLKFHRKRILCAIHLNDFEQGRQTLTKMSSASQKDPLTSYLVFRLALLGWDHELGRKCLENLSCSPIRGQCNDMLYACIKEAQHAGDKICTVEAMKAITKAPNIDDSVRSNYPSLLRCTVRLITMINESVPETERVLPNGNVAEDLCATFEKGHERTTQCEDEETNTIDRC